MKAHVALIVAFASVGAFPISSQAQQPGWIADPRTACQVWDIYPVAGETMNWSGACRDGMAEGRGVVQYSHQGVTGGRYEGDYKKGKLQGRGSYLFESGSRYEGDFHDTQFNGQGTYFGANGSHYVGQWSGDKPNGQGTYTKGNETYTGTWTNGCFKQGDRWTSLMASAQECGFR